MRRGLGCRLEAGFKRGDLLLQRFQPGPRAAQHDHLTVELFTADQLQLAERTLHQGFELTFKVGTGAGTVPREQTRRLVAEGIEKGFGREHGATFRRT